MIYFRHKKGGKANRFYWKQVSCLFLMLTLSASLTAQNATTPRLSFFQAADTLDKTRLWVCAGSGLAIYGAASIGLYNAWYRGYELSGFHTFNDLGEWNDMDKGGHFLTTYTETALIFKGARWTGMNRKAAAWTAAGIGLGLQTTVEVMDGFSEKWGFSWSDMAFNSIGAGLFLTQELLWQEQKVVAKLSYTRPDYPVFPIRASNDGSGVITLAGRAKELYGVAFAESFLKDYNALTVWASFNLRSLTGAKSGWLPPWLNLAVGYGAENVYGGFSNNWTDDSGNDFSVDPELYPRYRQFYLSFDVDLSRIPTRSHFLKTLFTVLNWVKIPGPALEINTLGGVKFHGFYW
ncbi:MAG: DUF2279 domain-containing protein [Saprospiraceae bacterium]|nr:DUF2279 domain-containing protein [Saprospiraceae bacterium]